MAENEEGQEQEQEGQQEGQEDGKSADKGKVPYERLEQVSKQNQELRKQVDEFKVKLSELESPIRFDAEAQKQKAEKEKFFQDPYGTFNEKIRAVEQKIEKEKAELQDTNEYRLALSQLQSSSEFNKDLEDAMVAVIKQHGLQEFGKARALKLAYQAATGKEWGTWGKDGYSTRQMKERVARPSSSGSAGAGMMTPEQYKNLDMEEYAKNQKKYDDALVAYRASLR